MFRLAPLAVLFLVAATPPDEVVIAEVDGRGLTRQDLNVYLALRGVPESASPAFRERAARELVDRELIRRFLERNKVEADAEQLAAAVRSAKERLAAGGRNPDEQLASLGVGEGHLRTEVALPLAWEKLARRAVTDKQIRNHFEKHHRRLDGTRLRVAQIFVRYEPGESPKAAPNTTARLAALRGDIASGKVTFEDAARAQSEAPTASGSGEVGWIRPAGDLPAVVTDAAFDLEKGAVSEVALSRFGAHLVTVLEVEPGDLSLEDARPTVFDELSQALWNETVAAERKTAKIVTEEIR